MFNSKSEDQNTDFLFRCIDCEMILDVNLEEEVEIQETRDDRTILTCPCGGMMNVLLD